MLLPVHVVFLLYTLLTSQAATPKVNSLMTDWSKRRLVSFTAASFVKISSGFCNSIETRGYIRNHEGCDLGAAAVGWFDTTSSVGCATGNCPPGCSYENSKNQLQMNTNRESSTPCSTSNSCLCVNAPKCTSTDGLTENAHACTCGSSACGSGSGMYCLASENLCGLGPICQNRDASVPTTYDCICGDTVSCTSLSKPYCYAADDVCKSIPNCAVADGSSANTGVVKCTCGDVGNECTSSTGMYCYSPTSWCGTTSDLTITYPLVSSGSCTSQEYRVAVTNSECFDDAVQERAYGHNVPSEYHDWGSNSNYPSGCFISSSQVFWNQYGTPGDGCSRSSYVCLCKAVPACSNINGITMNSHACFCGSSICEISTGLFCTKSINRCTTSTRCIERDGTKANPASCTCEHSDCTSSTGLFCYASESRCGRGPPCMVRDGTNPNAVSCTCGDSQGEDCHPDVGMFCYADINKCKTWGACKVRDGSFVNPSTCDCARKDCSTGTGLFCFAAEKACGTSSDVTITYPLVSSGSCTSQEYRVAVTNSECFDDAVQERAYGHNVPSEYHDWGSNSNYPSGCFISSSQVFWNQYGTPGDGCSRSSYVCLCKAVPACSNINGLIANGAACYCGPNICNDGGMRCDQTSGSCTYPLPCTHTDGTTPHTTTPSCRCGASSCTSTTGMYCTKSSSYCGCPPGKFKPFHGLPCAECAPGQFNDQPGQTSCEGKCSPGKYSGANGLSSDNQCMLCPNGKYSYVAGSTTAAACEACDRGSVMLTSWPDTLTCRVCGTGKIQTFEPLSTTVECVNCPYGRYLLDNGTDTFLHDEISDCKTCDAGYEIVSSVTGCRVCKQGRYQNISGVAGAQCLDCPHGRYLLDRATSASEHNHVSKCLQCNKGRSFVNRTSLCAVCSAGTFQDRDDIDAVSCTRCPEGRYLLDDAGIDDSKHILESQCLKCTKGREFVNDITECAICRAGRFQPRDDTDFAQCEKCPKGTFNADKRDLALKHDNANDCDKCPNGRISGEGASFCFECPAGWANDSSTAVGCVECSVGRRSVDHGVAGFQCKSCEKGMFQDVKGRAFCLPCVPGKFQDELGKSGCKKCKVNSFANDTSLFRCELCPRGYASVDEGASSCVPVPPGSYVDNETNATKKCEPGYKCEGGSTGRVPCPPGSYANALGSVLCIKCAPGRATALWATQECGPCEKNKVASISGRIYCRACKAGEITKGKGSTLCLPVPTGSYLDSATNTTLVCEPGFKCEGQNTGRVPCAPGFYAKNNGSLSCVECPPGRATASFASTFCPKCAKNTFSSEPGSISCDACKAGQSTTGEGSTLCVKVPPGSYVSNTNVTIKCEPGYKCEGEAAGRKACPPGSYAETFGSVACIECAPGRASSSWGTAFCKECDEHKIAAASNQTHCAWCPLGRISPGKAGTTCAAVPPGSYINETNKTMECEPGYKCEGEAAGRKACPPGSYSSGKGSVICLSCSPGRYSEKTGSVECEDCPSGWFQESEASTSCNRPAAGSIAAPGGVSSISISQGWTAGDCDSSGVCNTTRACAAGTFEDGTRTCKSCPAGEFILKF